MALLAALHSTDPTLAEIQSLEQQNLCRMSMRPGKRTVSAAFLSSPSESLSSSSSASSSASIRTRNFITGSLRGFDIPIAAESVDALEFIGFSPQTANQIFQRYQSRPSQDRNPDSLMDFVYSHVSMLNLPQARDLSPRQACSRLGLTTKLQDAILNPRFEHIFLTETLAFWVKDTLRSNYASLLQLHRRMKNHARASGRKPKRSSLHGAFPTPPADPAQVGSQPGVTATVSMTPNDYNLPANHIALESDGCVFQDHFVLYKGKAASEMIDNCFIEDDGSLNMDAVASHAGGDFNAMGRAWYWTPDKETAEDYRQFAAIRCPWAETWLIQIQIPRSFIDGLKKSQLWYSPDWKEYIWHCKRQQPPPAKFDHLWKEGQTDLIRGHICRGNTAPLARMRRENEQTLITDDNVMRKPNTNDKAQQVVFMQRESVTQLGELIRGKVHIEITGATQVGLQDTP